MFKLLKNILWVLLISFLLLFIPRLAGMIASSLNYQVIDTDGAFAWVSIHHISQALIFVILMILIKKIKSIEFGFNWGNREAGKQYLISFFKYFSMYTVGAFITVVVTKSFQPFTFPLSTVNILGQLGFQLLLSGPSEELIFRSFAITMLALVIEGRVFKGKVSLSNIMSAVIFGLAHVGFTLRPFELRYSVFQVVYAIILGLFYGECYEKSESVIYPMIMHSFTNVLMVGLTIVLSFIL
ncbi:CPBP family intramembrane glutamic endopeptidase [Serpentinicella alkaliphila]|uniref:CAAX prenyl protease-like protein n=1 Tax=Serpentinicella alkaliphila TaxID=1734049 RepID=A0A4R2TNG0_9FIRM|nr:CPBP family intramembrane glutamic endopeptidase [Serpentinicella alkaliphila]QUH27127.1 CPBP family intramembrane metalloprotease [Serpentinicella alkaliphila]TCQ05258.1 CAAX prenyl protease-like protein [Serpentinicella alkaliphila]